MKISFCFILICITNCCISQSIVGGEEVPIKIVNYNKGGTLLGRTHLNPYEIKIINSDSTWSFNIGTANGDIKCFSFSPDNQFVIIGTYIGYVEYWNIKEGLRAWAKKVHNGQINDIKFLDSNTVISCGRDGAIVSTLVTDQSSSVLKQQASKINCLEILNNKKIAFGDHDGFIGIISPSINHLHLSINAHQGFLFDLVFDSIRDVLFSAGYDGNIKAWNSELEFLYKMSNEAKPLFTIDIDKKGSFLTSGGINGKVDLWDLKSKKFIKSFSGHKDYIFVVRFTPFGEIISGSRDLTFRIWKL